MLQSDIPTHLITGIIVLHAEKYKALASVWSKYSTFVEQGHTVGARSIHRSAIS
jgi:hypothetical protein